MNTTIKLFIFLILNAIFWWLLFSFIKFTFNPILWGVESRSGAVFLFILTIIVFFIFTLLNKVFR